MWMYVLTQTQHICATFICSASSAAICLYCGNSTQDDGYVLTCLMYLYLVSSCKSSMRNERWLFCSTNYDDHPTHLLLENNDQDTSHCSVEICAYFTDSHLWTIHDYSTVDRLKQWTSFSAFDLYQKALQWNHLFWLWSTYVIHTALYTILPYAYWYVNTRICIHIYI
jgi:hypothetical protein